MLNVDLHLYLVIVEARAQRNRDEPGQVFDAYRGEPEMDLPEKEKDKHAAAFMETMERLYKDEEPLFRQYREIGYVPLPGGDGDMNPILNFKFRKFCIFL